MAEEFVAKTTPSGDKKWILDGNLCFFEIEKMHGEDINVDKIKVMKYLVRPTKKTITRYNLIPKEIKYGRDLGVMEITLPLPSLIAKKQDDPYFSNITIFSCDMYGCEDTILGGYLAPFQREKRRLMHDVLFYKNAYETKCKELNNVLSKTDETLKKYMDLMDRFKKAAMTEEDTGIPPGKDLDK